MLLGGIAAPVHAAREAKVAGGASEGDIEASRLLDRAQELLAAQETERGVKMLESIVEQYPNSPVRFTAYLALGRHYLATHEQLTAINYLNNLKALEQPDEALTGADLETYLEGLYLSGVAYFQIRQFGAAFPLLRKITNDYPNTVWANQAYYYIGMCHFAQQNWSKAIEALSLVGTFVDPQSPTIQFIEAGRRFYVKIADPDLPVLATLGQKIQVELATARGDKETATCIPLSAEGDVFIGSMTTAIGVAKPNDGVLQVIGGDAITTQYTDRNTQDGQANVPRNSKVEVVSTAALLFTLGDYESPATVAFLDQPLFVTLHDVDLDQSANADSVAVKAIARYVDEVATAEATAAGKGGLERLLQAEEKKWIVRDSVTLTLTEIGAAPVHSGRFGGSLAVTALVADKPVNQGDNILTTAIDDEILVSYVDERHINGVTPRAVETKVVVLGEIDNRPRATQDVVSDPVIRAKKHLVEGTAYLELARIFRSMGLTKGAKEKAAEGLERAEFIIRTRSPLPSELKQDAFKLKWELHLAADDFASAMATCQLFNRLYPDSPFVDEALLGIANIHRENKRYADAMGVYRQVLALPKSRVKPEAQFRIAECTEIQAKPGSESAIAEYKLCAERYPESEYAGASLAKLVDYHIDSRDFVQANDLLEQVFQDYPDAKFLDSMLLKWVLVAFNAGDIAKAHEKCSQLLFEYPESPLAEKAKGILPKIEARLKKGSDTPTQP